MESTYLYYYTNFHFVAKSKKLNEYVEIKNLKLEEEEIIRIEYGIFYKINYRLV